MPAEGMQALGMQIEPKSSSIEELERFSENLPFVHGGLIPSHLCVDYPIDRESRRRRGDRKELRGMPRGTLPAKNHPPFFQALLLGTPGQPCNPPLGARAL